MEWYIPMTIIPGVGLIILSTSNIMLNLNGEISALNRGQNSNKKIIKAKLSQLKRLSISIIFQYVGLLFFLFSGISLSIIKKSDPLAKGFLLIGVITLTISILILLVYSIKAVAIRQEHLSQ